MDEKIKAVMAMVFGKEPSDIAENASPDTIEEWDSLNHMNLIVGLEEEFGVEFSEEQIASMLNYKLIKLTLEEL